MSLDPDLSALLQRSDLADSLPLGFSGSSVGGPASQALGGGLVFRLAGF
jgi:hypothetical protein